MPRLRLVHWHEGEAAERVAALRGAGYAVDFDPVTPATLRALRERPPDGIVIDLSRLPGQGRDIAFAVRRDKRTRRVPIVFAGGSREKVRRIKTQIPDAVFTSWKAIRRSLQRALATPPRNPAVPKSLLAGYSGTPLAKKLGIKADAVIALSGAPPGFEALLGTLPAGVTVRHQARGRRDLTIWFTRSLSDLRRRIRTMAAQVQDGGLWIAWPKKTSGFATDVSQTAVRQAGLTSGLVDYKICAIDETWSGLKFARRK